jgi:hypothetical protein
MASHSASASRLAKASDIRYAVISGSFVIARLVRANNGSDGGALADASCDKALTWEMLRPECGRRPIQKTGSKSRLKKPATGFPARAQLLRR